MKLAVTTIQRLFSYRQPLWLLIYPSFFTIFSLKYFIFNSSFISNRCLSFIMIRNTYSEKLQIEVNSFTDIAIKLNQLHVPSTVYSSGNFNCSALTHIIFHEHERLVYYKSERSGIHYSPYLCFTLNFYTTRKKSFSFSVNGFPRCCCPHAESQMTAIAKHISWNPHSLDLKLLILVRLASIQTSCYTCQNFS